MGKNSRGRKQKLSDLYQLKTGQLCYAIEGDGQNALVIELYYSPRIFLKHCVNLYYSFVRLSYFAEPQPLYPAEE